MSGNLNPNRNGRQRTFAVLRVLACLTLLSLTLGVASSLAQIPDLVYLWPQGAPRSEGKTAAEYVRLTEDGEHIISSINRPAILPYLPDKGSATGAAVLVIPGGGHRELWMDHEGYNVAAWLSHHGVAAFVLKYRLAKEPVSAYTVEGTELNDTQRALQLIKSRAAEWGVDPNRLGVMGFSAGGELALLASTRFDEGNPGGIDPIDRLSSRPAFQALLYPAIPSSMKLTKDTPPAFLACGEADRDDIAIGVPGLYLALRKEGLSAELHVYAKTGHGFGLRDRNSGSVAGWISLVYEWLHIQGLLKHQ
jgi:endo-1,4-beta-xylanase